MGPCMGPCNRQCSWMYVSAACDMCRCRDRWGAWSASLYAPTQTHNTQDCSRALRARAHMGTRGLAQASFCDSIDIDTLAYVCCGSSVLLHKMDTLAL